MLLKGRKVFLIDLQNDKTPANDNAVSETNIVCV